MPRGNQVEVLECVRRESLSVAETGEVVDLLLASSTREQKQFLLEKPRQAMARRLGISRYQVARVLAAHEAGRAQGVSQLPQAKSRRSSCLDDNMKVVVTGYDGDEPVYNTRFLAFATHYGYRPVACRPRRSCTKGKVERPRI